MNEKRKITVSVPTDLLASAMAVTGEGPKETVRRGLELVAARAGFGHLRSLRGKVQFSLGMSDLRDDRE